MEVDDHRDSVKSRMIEPCMQEIEENISANSTFETKNARHLIASYDFYQTQNVLST